MGCNYRLQILWQPTYQPRPPKLAWLPCQKVAVLGPLNGVSYGFVGSQRCRPGGLFRDLTVRHWWKHQESHWVQGWFGRSLDQATGRLWMKSMIGGLTKNCSMNWMNSHICWSADFPFTNFLQGTSLYIRLQIHCQRLILRRSGTQVPLWLFSTCSRPRDDRKSRRCRRSISDL